MYKLTRPDGFNFYSRTINYRDAIGTTIRVTDFDPPKKGPSGKGLYASENPNDCFVGAKIPCAAFLVEGIDLIAKGSRKSRYQALKVIEEIHGLDRLFGWRYSDAINPINPFEILPPEITADHVELVKDWINILASVRASVWDNVRDNVRDSVGDSVGASVWASVGASVGASVWDNVRDSVGDSVGASVWASVGASVGASVWASVGDSVGAYIGSLFPNVKRWKYVEHKEGEYPFQSCVDLWKAGLVPSFDGSKWRLHGGPKAEILWESN